MYKKGNEKSKIERCAYAPGKIQCLECKREGKGAWFKFVMQHVKYAHQLDKGSYKSLHGLNRGTGILSEDVKEKKREATLTNGTMENLDHTPATLFQKGDHSLGRYERRAQTLEQLAVLHKHTEVYKRAHNQ